MVRLVLFDWDGVFIDSMRFCWYIHRIKNPDLSWEDFQKMSHGNFHDSLQGRSDFRPEPRFEEKYLQFAMRTVIKDSIIKMVIDLSYDHILVIVSSGHEHPIKESLKRNTILHLFSDVLGCETDRSKIVKIGSACKKYGVKEKDVVFITDSLGDIAEANHAGVRSVIATTWGIHDEPTLQRGSPRMIVRDRRHLMDAVRAAVR